MQTSTQEAPAKVCTPWSSPVHLFPEALLVASVSTREILVSPQLLAISSAVRAICPPVPSFWLSGAVWWPQRGVLWEGQGVDCAQVAVPRGEPLPGYSVHPSPPSPGVPEPSASGRMSWGVGSGGSGHAYKAANTGSCASPLHGALSPRDPVLVLCAPFPTWSPGHSERPVLSCILPSQMTDGKQASHPVGQPREAQAGAGVLGAGTEHVAAAAVMRQKVGAGPVRARGPTGGAEPLKHIVRDWGSPHPPPSPPHHRQGGTCPLVPALPLPQLLALLPACPSAPRSWLVAAPRGTGQWTGRQGP